MRPCAPKPSTKSAKLQVASRLLFDPYNYGPFRAETCQNEGNSTRKPGLDAPEVLNEWLRSSPGGVRDAVAEVEHLSGVLDAEQRLLDTTAIQLYHIYRIILYI